MTAPKISITLSATDRATAVVRKFNDRLAQMTRPVRQTMQNFRKLANELRLNPIVKGFTGILKAAGGAAGAILGVGAAIAGVELIRSSAQIAEWAAKWGDAGNEILRTGSAIGVNTTELQTARAAAVAFGLTADDMTSSLRNVAQTLQDARFGRNQPAMQMMNKLGIHLHRLKDGSVDAVDGLMQVFRAIHNQRGQQPRAEIAQMFGIDALLPLAQKGPDYFRKLEEEIRRTNMVLGGPALENMNAFHKDMVLMQDATIGLGNSLANRLLPYLDPATKGLTSLVERLTAAIDKYGLLGAAQRAAERTGLTDTPKTGKQKASPGWLPTLWQKTFREGGPIQWWANPFAGGQTSPGGQVTSGAQSFNALVELVRRLEHSGDRAVSKAQGAGHGGAVGRFQVMPDTARRYGFDPSRLTDPVYNEKVARTILADLARKYHGNLDDILIGYNSTPKRVTQFERSGHSLDALMPETRKYLMRAHGSALLRLIEGGENYGTLMPPSMIAALARSRGPSKLSGVAGARRGDDVRVTSSRAAVDVNVKFANAPAGTTAKAKGGGAAGAPVNTTLKIDYAMPDLATP